MLGTPASPPAAPGAPPPGGARAGPPGPGGPAAGAPPPRRAPPPARLRAVPLERRGRVSRSAAALLWAGRGWVGPLPAPVLLLFAAYAAAGLVLGHTRFGRHVRAVGDGAAAARSMGLGVGRVLAATYAI